jgi:hypothetical protein
MHAQFTNGAVFFFCIQDGIEMQDLSYQYAKKLAESLKINLQTLQLATEDFSSNNKIGQGAFGTVYKVWKFNVASSLIVGSI